jgi:hypothetical protein
MIVFPHANGHTVPVVDFVVAWIAFMCLHGRNDVGTLRSALPTRALKESLQSHLRRGQRFSLDVLCRCLVPVAYRHLAQATPDFPAANEWWIELADDWRNCRTGQRPKAARFTGQTVNAWEHLTQRAQSEKLHDAWETILDCYA